MSDQPKDCGEAGCAEGRCGSGSCLRAAAPQSGPIPDDTLACEGVVARVRAEDGDEDDLKLACNLISEVRAAKTNGDALASIMGYRYEIRSRALAASQATEQPKVWTDAHLRGIASDYFPRPEDWPAAMLCMRHLLMEQGKATEQPTMPAGWVPLRLEWEPGYPEDVAFGPQHMMDRLKKWLDKFLAMRLAEQPADRAQRDELPPLPTPWDYCYVWNGPYGKRKFTAAHHNGRACDDQVLVFTADQMHEYARAALQRKGD